MPDVYLLRLAFILILAERGYRLLDLGLHGPFGRAILPRIAAQGTRRRALLERWGGTLAALLVFTTLLAACVVVAPPQTAPGYLSPEGINLLATPAVPLAWPTAILPPPVRWPTNTAVPPSAARPASYASPASPASPLATPGSAAALPGSPRASAALTQTRSLPLLVAAAKPAGSAGAASPGGSPAATPAEASPTYTPAPAETDPALDRGLRATLQAARATPFIATPTPVPQARAPRAPAPSLTGSPSAGVRPLTPLAPPGTPASVTPQAITSTIVPTPAHVITEHVSFVGDSVMLGAAAQIRALGNVDVDARVSRQVGEVLQILYARHAAGTLGPIVVLHIGNNGTFTPQQFDEIMALLADRRQVIFLTVKVPRVWAGPNNAVLAEGAARHPNVTLVDWAGLTANRPDLFWADGMHLRPEGARFYTDLIVANLKP